MGFWRTIPHSIELLLIAAVFSGCAANGVAGVIDPSPVPPTSAPAPQSAAATAVPRAASVSPEPASATPGLPSLLVVAVGDSIGYNSSEDCPGCTGFVQRYAEAISAATGRPVGTIRNLTQHNGLKIGGLLDELKNDSERQASLTRADIILVGIAHNATSWNVDDDPCDGPNSANIDWSKYTPACALAAAEQYRPKYESLFSQIAALRAGKPTLLRTINAYNDWIGAPNMDLPPQGAEATHFVLDEWDAMICKAAEANGFGCADVYHAFNGKDGRTPSDDLLANDYTHPSDRGNEVIARALSDLGFAPLAGR